MVDKNVHVLKKTLDKIFEEKRTDELSKSILMIFNGELDHSDPNFEYVLKYAEQVRSNTPAHPYLEIFKVVFKMHQVCIQKKQLPQMDISLKKTDAVTMKAFLKNNNDSILLSLFAYCLEHGLLVATPEDFDKDTQAISTSKDQAIHLYEKALVLDPTNHLAKARLTELRQPSTQTANSAVVTVPPSVPTSPAPAVPAACAVPVPTSATPQTSISDRGQKRDFLSAFSSSQHDASPYSRRAAPNLSLSQPALARVEDETTAESFQQPSPFFSTLGNRDISSTFQSQRSEYSHPHTASFRLFGSSQPASVSRRTFVPELSADLRPGAIMMLALQHSDEKHRDSLMMMMLSRSTDIPGMPLPSQPVHRRMPPTHARTSSALPQLTPEMLRLLQQRSGSDTSDSEGPFDFINSAFSNSLSKN